MELEEMIQMNDLIKSFKVSRTTIYEWMRKDDFPRPSKIGGKNFWKKSEIEAYIESTRRQPKELDATREKTSDTTKT